MATRKRTGRNSEPDQAVETARTIRQARTTGLYDSLLSVAGGEVSKVLGVQRWTVQREPFSGFGSPPGRF